MTTEILALTDALGNLVRFDLLPGHRYDTIGVPPLLEGIDFAALIADKAFRQQRHHRRLERARRQDRYLPASASNTKAPARRRDVQVASSDRELLLQTQGVQTHRNARLQNRPELQSQCLSRRRRHQLTLNLNRP